MVFLTRIGFGTILVIFPIYLKTGPSSLAAIITPLYPAVERLTALPVRAYVDFQGKKASLHTGMATISILTCVIGVSNNSVIVAGAHAVEGLAAAIVTISSVKMITDLTVQQNRGAGRPASPRQASAMTENSKVGIKLSR